MSETISENMIVVICMVSVLIALLLYRLFSNYVDKGIIDSTIDNVVEAHIFIYGNTGIDIDRIYNNVIMELGSDFRDWRPYIRDAVIDTVCNWGK